MKKGQKIWLALFVIGLIIFAVIKLSGFRVIIGEPLSITPTPDPLLADLSELIASYENGKTSTIDFSTVTTFSWDRLYFVEPYTQPSELDSLFGKSWRQNCFTKINYSDGYTLLIFTNANTVVHCLDYPRDKSYFIIPSIKYEQGFSHQEALFVSDGKGRLKWADYNK